MTHELLAYYESELRFIREMGGEFARNYPKVAERLLLKENDCQDPHVERLIEAFALLAGRIRHKIDDEFPEITESLIDLLYPHYLRPVPPMAIAQFALDQKTTAGSGGHVIPRGVEVRTRLIRRAGTHCTFQSGYPVTLWPVEVTGASMLSPGEFPPGVPAERAVAAIRIELRCPHGMAFPAIGLDQLRFYIDGDEALVHTLYELIFNNAFRVALIDRSKAQRRPVSQVFPPDCLRPVGFERNEALLPCPDRSFPGYGLLQEYFSFPSKFQFFDLAGFDQLDLQQFGDRAEIVVFLSDFERDDRLAALEQGIRAETFQLGCTPIINLFPKDAEPIRLSHARSSYPIVPDLKFAHAMEVYSVDRVRSTGGAKSPAQDYEPFYSLRHSYEDRHARPYWYANRRPATRTEDRGTEVDLYLVNPHFRPDFPVDEALMVDLTCTNRDLTRPDTLRVRREFGELWLELRPGVRARFLHQPTPSQRPPLRNSLQWRFISQLSLNHLSLTDANALREILRLYNYSPDPALRKQIDGIVAVSAETHLAPITAPQGIAFVLGLRAKIEFDEAAFPAGSPYLLASVLERFLGLYSALNSFSQLEATVVRNERKEVLRQWKPRAGDQILL